MSGGEPLPSPDHDIAADVLAQLEARGITADDRLIALIQVVLNVTQTRGTMITAEEIARLQVIVPDAGERMMRRIEVEQAHRHALERFVVLSDLCEKALGQVLGLIGSLAGLYTAYHLVAAGYSVAGAAIGVAALGYPTVAMAFVGRKTYRNPLAGQAEP